MMLKKIFEYVGDRIGIHLEVVMTDGRQPVGRGIGPVLEVRDVMQVLENHPGAPQDLRYKALVLAGRILEFHPDVRGGSGFRTAEDILESGRALAKMKAIIAAQGKRGEMHRTGPLAFDVLAGKDGWISDIDNRQLNKIARLAGAPMDKGAGIDLFKKLNDKITKGETLYRIYAEFEPDFRFAVDLAARDNAYTIADSPSDGPDTRDY